MYHAQVMVLRQQLLATNRACVQEMCHTYVLPPENPRTMEVLNKKRQALIERGTCVMCCRPFVMSHSIRYRGQV